MADFITFDSYCNMYTTFLVSTYIFPPKIIYCSQMFLSFTDNNFKHLIASYFRWKWKSIFLHTFKHGSNASQTVCNNKQAQSERTNSKCKVWKGCWKVISLTKKGLKRNVLRFGQIFGKLLVLRIFQIHTHSLI